MEQKNQNVFQKLQKIRVEIQKMNLKKSGFNKFANYYYYELSDFLPSVNELCNENGLCTIFKTDGLIAILKVVNAEKIEEIIEFKSNVKEATMKGALPIQMLGAEHTYMRRYLMINAFEICESDAVDGLPEDKKELKPVEQKKAEIKTSELLKQAISEMLNDAFDPKLLWSKYVQFQNNADFIKAKELRKQSSINNENLFNEKMGDKI